MWAISYAGSPPVEPPDLVDVGDVDEAPGRHELRRQIARLERQLAQVTGLPAKAVSRPVHPLRGPALLTAAELEAVRDELLCALTAAAGRGSPRCAPGGDARGEQEKPSFG